MAKTHKPLYRSLYFQVICAIVVGVLVGHFYPETGTAMIMASGLGAASVPARPRTENRSSSTLPAKKMATGQSGQSRSLPRFTAMANSG